MNITQIITLDLAKSSAFTCICTKQGDEKSRMVQIRLTNGGAAYQPPSGAGARFRAQKPDGTMVLNPAAVNPDGTVTVELTRQTLAVPGEVTADVYLTDSTGSVLSSASFVIHVEPAPSGMQTDSENEFLHLTALADRAEKAAFQAQAAEQNATQIVQSAADHAARRDNPHSVTKAQVGLGNVDNTPDMEKPLSAAQSAALNAHTGNTANPHGVTAQQIGAAPAGYGLGGDAKLINSGESLNQYTDSGFYRWGEGTANAPFGAGSMIVVKRSDAYVYQLAFRNDVQRVEIAVRVMTDGVYYDWEWINPPMNAGVAYRTTCKYQGNPVYTKLIDCGTLPHNSRKNVGYGETGITVIRISASTNDGASFPRFSGAGNTPNFTISTYSGEMQIITSGMSGASSSKVFAQIWYTK